MIKVISRLSIRGYNLKKSIALLSLIFLICCELLFSETLKKDSLVTFRLINAKTGVVVSGIETVFSVSSTDSTFIASNVRDAVVKSTTSGSVDAQLIGGKGYRASVSFLKNGVPASNGIDSPDGKYYVIPRETIQFTASQDLRNFVDFLLAPSEALLDVNVVDEKGAAVQSGYVQAYSEASGSSNGESKEHVSGDRISDGKVTLPVLGDRGYRVSFSAPSSDLVSLEPIQIRVGAIGRYGLKIPIKTAEHSIVVTASVGGEVPKPDLVSFFFCYAFNSADQYVKGGASDGGTVNLMVENTIGARWQVGCQMSLDRGGVESFYTGEVSYKVNDQSSNSLVVSLEEVEGYFPETAYPIAGGEESTFKTPDGEAEISIPEGLFSKEDDVSIVLQTGRGYVTTSASKPMVAYDIRFYKNDLQVREVEEPVVISIPVDKDRVKELGGTVDNVYPASYDQESGKWVREPNYTYDQSSDTIKIYASHFSVWGLLVDLLKTVTDTAPVNLRVAVPQTAQTGKRAVLLYWGTPVDGPGSEYRVEVAMRTKEFLAANQEKKRKKQFRYFIDWANAKVLSTTSLKVRTKLSPGTYQFRVKKTGGAYSLTKQFKVR